MDTVGLEMLDKLAVIDQKIRRQMVYQYQMAKDHPTAEGRKKAAIMHASLHNYLADIWDSWKTIKLACYPVEKETT